MSCGSWPKGVARICDSKPIAKVLAIVLVAAVLIWWSGPAKRIPSSQMGKNDYWFGTFAQ